MTVSLQTGAEMTTSPFGNVYDDSQYDAIRSQLLAKIGIDFSKPDTWPSSDEDRVAQLFNEFKARSWFIYSMMGLPIRYLLKSETEIEKDPDHLGGGDCLTLCSVFILIAKNEFGVTVKLECHKAPFVTDAKATLDKKATGNCNKGSKWFFQNHYWVSFKDKSYDLLFGSEGAPKIDEQWSLDKTKAPATPLKNAMVVVPGPEYEQEGIRGRLKDAYQLAKLTP